MNTKISLSNSTILIVMSGNVGVTFNPSSVVNQLSILAMRPQSIDVP